MKGSKKWILWVFVFLWMGNILTFSSQPAEISKRQSGFFTEITNKIFVYLENKYDIKQIGLDRIDHFIRKSAHVFNYFILTLLLIFAWLANNNKSAYLSWTISTLFSVLDETYQLFIPGRSGMFRDVLIDQIGTIIALLLIYVVLKKQWLLKD